MEKSQKISILATVVLIGFIVGVIAHYILGAYLGFGFPLNTFLFTPEQHFSDFTDMMLFVNNLAPFASPNEWINYFPLAYILLFPFSLIPNPIFAYCIFSSIFITFFIIMSIKKLHCNDLTKLQNFQNIFVIICLSYPVLLMLDRGNFDMLLFIIFAGFVYTFNNKKYLISAILLAVENAIKPFTIFFLILFLIKRKYKEFFLSILITLLLIMTGFMVLKGGFFNQIVVFIKNLTLFKLSYVYTVKDEYGATNSASLFMALKFLLCNLTSTISTSLLDKIYTVLDIIISATVILFTVKEKIFWKRITLLTLLMVLVPYVSLDYKLVFLFVPIWLFVNTEEKTKFDSAYAILFGLLMIPKQFFAILTPAANNLIHATTFGILINPILIIILICLIIFEQISQNSRQVQK